MLNTIMYYATVTFQDIQTETHKIGIVTNINVDKDNLNRIILFFDGNSTPYILSGATKLTIHKTSYFEDAIKILDEIKREKILNQFDL